MKSILRISLLITILYLNLAAQTMSTEKVIPGFTLFSGYGGNILLVETKKGDILVDSGTAEGFKTLVKEVPKIDYLLTTHRHKDHIGGNNYYGKNGAVIIAQENSAKYIKEKDSGVQKDGYANIAFEDRLTLEIDGERIELIYYPNAHTNGDYVVYFPKKNLIHLADISFGNMYNYLDTNYGATIDGLINATKNILKLVNDETIIIPGHGKIMNKNDLKRNLKMFEDVKASIKILKDKGMSLEEVIQENPTKKYDDSYSWQFITAEKFVTPIYNTIK